MTEITMTASERERVIKAAGECFDRKSVERTTFAQIGDETGIAVEDIKAEFRTKTTLVLEVQIHQLDKLKQEYLVNMPDATPRNAIKFILRSRIYFGAKRPDRTYLFFINALERRQPWSSYLDKFIWQFSIEFATLIERGVREGNYKKGTDVNVVVRTLSSIYLTGLVMIGLREKEFDPDIVWDFIEPQVDLVFDSIHN